MADTILGEGSFNNDAATWQIDYDSTSETLGITVTGSASKLVVTVTFTSSQQTFSLDCIHGPAGNVLNAGRVVLAGPGSVLGHPQVVAPGSFPLPPFPRGTSPPYTFDSTWNA